MRKFVVFKQDMLCRVGGKHNRSAIMTEEEAIERGTLNGAHICNFTFYELTEVRPVDLGWKLK